MQTVETGQVPGGLCRAAAAAAIRCRAPRRPMLPVSRPGPMLSRPSEEAYPNSTQPLLLLAFKLITLLGGASIDFQIRQ